MTVLHRRARPLLGTLVGVTAEAHDAAVARVAVESAFAEVRRLEAMFSPARASSAVAALNAARGAPLVAPPEVRAVLALALQVARASHGAFDPTWAPLGEVWRIGAEDFRVPSVAALSRARAAVDFRAVRLEGHTVQLRPRTRLGLGGVAKGFIADQAAAAALAAGASSVLVDAGGDLVARGPRGWRVGVRHPRRPELLQTLELRDAALVTSGDSERVSVRRGHRYHHLLDPRTGRPARRCQSVTVLALSGALADALATALFVAGPRGAPLLRQFPGTRALLVGARGALHRTP